MEVFMPAIVAFLTAITVVFIRDYLGSRGAARKDAARINSEYLNPLSLYCEETYFRLYDILRRIDESEDNRCEVLLFVENESELSGKGAQWFNHEGGYLISTCYFTACLFYCIAKVREDIPYLRLSKEKDSLLRDLMYRVSKAFREQLGVFYSIQLGIGHSIYSDQDLRMKTYREFCEALQDPDERVWFGRLVNFYIDTGRGEKRERVEKALVAIQDLSKKLDQAVNCDDTLARRLQSEGLVRRG